MAKAIAAGKGPATWLGVVQETFVPMVFSGDLQPTGTDQVQFGLVEIYKLVEDDDGSFELVDTGSALTAANVSGCEIPIDSYVAMVLNPKYDGTDQDQPRLLIVAPLSCIGAKSQKLHGPCPNMPRTLNVEVATTQADSICMDHATGTLNLDEELGWFGSVVLPGCRNNDPVSGQPTPVIELLLSPTPLILDSAGSWNSTQSTPGDYLAVGIIGAGGGSGGANRGGGGGGALVAYFALSSALYHFTLVWDGSGNGVLTGSAGQSATAGGGQNGSAGGMGGGASQVGAAIFESFTGGNGSVAVVGGPGAGGGGAGTGGNGENAIDTGSGAPGGPADNMPGSVGGGGFLMFPGGCSGTGPNGNNTGLGGGGGGGGGGGSPTTGAPGVAMVYPSCISAWNLAIGGCLDGIDSIVTLISCSCDPLELIFEITDPTHYDCGSYANPLITITVTEPP